MNTLTDVSPPFQAPGIVKPRIPRIAGKLSRCCPGLGHIYAGDIRRGLMFLAVVDLPIVLGALIVVAPWGNLKVAVALWISALLLSVWSCFDVRKTVLTTRSDYRMKDYNHWMVYLVIGIVPTLAVAMATAVAIRSSILQVTSVESDLPQAGIERGDYLIEWKDAYAHKKPATGDCVVYRGPLGSGLRYISQVVGIPGDVVATDKGNEVIPQGFLEVKRTDGKLDRISEMAISGKAVYRFWPLNRVGEIGEK